MKNFLKAIGSLAIAAMLVFAMAACELPDEGVVLAWTEGNLATKAADAWHEIDVTKDTTYYVWVKEYWSGSVVAADGYGDVVTSAYYDSKTGTKIFENTNAGANSTTNKTDSWEASNFTATKTGKVLIKVAVDDDLFSGGPGKYKIAVTTESGRPSGE